MNIELVTIDDHDAALVIRQAPADQNPAAVYLAGLAPGSQRTMHHALATIADLLVPGASADTLPWPALRYAHTQAIRAALAARYDARTANKVLSALRGVLKAAWRLGEIATDDYMAAVDVPNVKVDKPEQAAGRALSLGEVMALVAACADDTPAGARDAAILGLGYAAGLRRAELAGLDRADYADADGWLTVRGKRNKTRRVPVANGARAALDDWLRIRGDDPGPIFWHINRASRLVNRRLTTQGIYVILARRAERAGVASFSPHDLRRTFAGDLLDAGADLATVQKLMGHSNPATTAGYDRRGERAKLDASKRLHYPYQGRR